MTPRSVRSLLAVGTLAWASALGGCAYYNGMYNTSRYVRLAERSERAGRVSEAADRWRQVLVHADTLLVRHPHSKWADDAELLKGRALVALRAYVQAVAVLENAAGRSGSDEQRREAQYWLALAHAGRGAYEPALASFDSALASPRPELQQRARLERGRMLIRMGRPLEALSDLEPVTVPEARFDRARAALAVERLVLAAASADSAVGVRSVRPEAWAAFLDSLARRGGPAAASRLVDRLAGQGSLASGARARLYLADGDRWAAAPGGDSMALERWAIASRAAPDSAEARAAEVRTLRLGLLGPGAEAALPATAARLAGIVADGGEPAIEAREILRVLALADSVARTGSWADAGAFQAAEWLRDSLGATALAAERFAAMAAGWPASPWAPKALLAAIAAGHPAADSLAQVLRGPYGASPYARVATGADPDPERFAVLEDSLRALLAAAPARAGAGAAARGVAAPVLQSDDADDRILAERAAERRRTVPAATRAPQAPVRAAPRRPAGPPRDPEP